MTQQQQQQWALFCDLVAQLTAPHSAPQQRSQAATHLLAAFEDPATAPMLCAQVTPPVVACSCSSGGAAAHEAVPGVNEASLFFAVKALRAAATSPAHDNAAAVADVMLQLCLHSHCACVTPVVRTQCHLGIADAAKMSVAQGSDGSSELSDNVFQVLAEACNSSDVASVAAAFAALTTVITELVQQDSRLTFQQQHLVGLYRSSRFSQLCELCVNVAEATIQGFSTGRYNLAEHRHILLGSVQTLRAFTSDSSNYDMLTEKFFEALFAAVEVSLSYIHGDSGDLVIEVCENVCAAVSNVIKRRYVPAGEAGVWFMTVLAQRTLGILTHLQSISSSFPAELSVQLLDVVEQFVRIHLTRFVTTSTEAQQFLADVCMAIADVSRFSHDHTVMACISALWIELLDSEEPVSTLLQHHTQTIAGAAHGFLCAALFERNPDLLIAILDDESPVLNAYDSTTFLSSIAGDDNDSPDAINSFDGRFGAADAVTRTKPSVAKALTTSETEDLEGSSLAEIYSCVRDVLVRMCQFAAVQGALAQEVQTMLPALLSRVDNEMASDERSAQMLDACFLISMLPVASTSAEALYENLLGILSTTKHVIVQRLFSAAPAFGFLACCSVDIVIPVLGSLSSHLRSWDVAALEALLTPIAESVNVALDFFVMPPPIGIASSGAQLLHACCRYLSPHALRSHRGMVVVLEKARGCLGNSSIPASVQSGLLLAFLELTTRAQDSSAQATYVALLNVYMQGIDAIRSQQSPNVLFGASIAAECLAVVLSERYRFSNKEEKAVIFSTLAQILHSDNMQTYFTICYSSNDGGTQAAATAQALLNLLYVAVRNYGKHVDNLLVVGVVSRSMEYVLQSYQHKASNGLSNAAKDLLIFQCATKLLQQTCHLGANAHANLQAAARAVAIVKDIAALFQDATQVMPDLLLPVVELLSTAANRFWHELESQDTGVVVQAGLVELCHYALTTDNIPPECAQACVLQLVQLDSQRGYFRQPWFVENYWLQLSSAAVQMSFSNSGAGALYSDDFAKLLYRLACVDLAAFMQSVVSPSLTAVLTAKPEAGLDDRRQFIFDQAVAHWADLVNAAERDLPEQLFMQALTRCRQDINALHNSQAGLLSSDQ